MKNEYSDGQNYRIDSFLEEYATLKVNAERGHI